MCFDEAGMEYGISPLILRAIAKVESNYNPNAVNKNRNGSYDFGVMQINSIWASSLGKETWNNLGDPCTNIKTGAKILSGCIKKYGYNWQAIGCYNSQTPGKSERYARLVFKELQHIQKKGEPQPEYAVAHETVHAAVPADPAPQASFAPAVQEAPAAPVVVDAAAEGLNASPVFDVQQAATSN